MDMVKNTHESFKTQDENNFFSSLTERPADLHSSLKIEIGKKYEEHDFSEL